MLEISDLVVDFDLSTLERRPVVRDHVVERLRRNGQVAAARIVARMPAGDGGVLDPLEVDRLLVRVHCEMQRLSEEFQHGQRMAELLRPLVPVLRERRNPVTIADVGCGTGYVIRWLAAHRALGEGVRLIGFDFNAALIDEARRLADIEGLDCHFVRGNAFDHELEADFYVSTGVLHHLRGPSLSQFFAAHAVPATSGFAHVDFQPSFLAPFGSWLFHVVRMREPLARHDGVASTHRVHDGETLLRVSGEASGFGRCLYGARLAKLPIKRVFHTLLGVRRELQSDVERALGSRRTRLGRWQ